ncbi:hypothetical protein [Pseudonocardia sp. NPDC049635]|uniref:hypothetical protein n=1 Tax=Pseudonocardia sp. NPDC049635 TaxID=3155506 RepID=UPI0033CBB201
MTLLDPDLLAAALRRCAQGDRAREAAVALLVAHRRWLRAPELQREVKILRSYEDGTPELAAVCWDAARQLYTDRAAPCSGSEWAVLGVAIDLATGALYDAAGSCDTHNTALITGAVAAAFGIRDLPPAPKENRQ